MNCPRCKLTRDNCRCPCIECKDKRCPDKVIVDLSKGGGR